MHISRLFFYMGVRPPIMRDGRVKRIEFQREFRQRRVHDASDRSQRMVGTHPLLKVNRAEQRSRNRVAATHIILAPGWRQSVRNDRVAARSFSAAC
jgi:hypothetical protein